MNKKQNRETVVCLHSALVSRMRTIYNKIGDSGQKFSHNLINECTDGLIGYLKLIHNGSLQDIEMWSSNVAKSTYKQLLLKYKEVYKEDFKYLNEQDNKKIH